MKGLYNWIFYQALPTLKPRIIPISRSKLPGYHIFLFDTETTGIGENDRIIEFGIKELGMTLIHPIQSKSYQFLVNPERPILNSNIHHITNDDVKDKRSMRDQLPQLVQFVNECAGPNIPVLFAHNAAFDVRMLFNSLETEIQEISTWRFGCTIQDLFKPIIGLPRNSLAYLAEHFHVTNNNEHRVMGDINTLESIIDLSCKVGDFSNVLHRTKNLPLSTEADRRLYAALKSLSISDTYVPSNWIWARIASSRPRTLTELRKLVSNGDFMPFYGSATVELINSLESDTNNVHVGILPFV